MSIDTLSIARDLKAAELSVVQAEAIAAAIGRSAIENIDSAATKADMSLLRSELAQMETRLEGKLEALHAKLLTWFIGAQVAVGALVVALVKL